MSILITGGCGLLGSTIAKQLDCQGHTLATTAHSHPKSDSADFDSDWYVIDITKPDEVQRLFNQVQPDWVIHCAAFTDVDGCEENPEDAFEVNAEGTRIIASAASKVDTNVCFISTDYVFGGSKTTPYRPDDNVSPLQVYGRTKALAERYVYEIVDDPLIARVSFLYGRNRATRAQEGVVPWILSASSTENNVSLYTDQFVSPTYAEHAGETILELISENTRGVFHCNNDGCVSPYELGEFVAKEQSRDTINIGKSSLLNADYPTKRPQYSCLGTSKTEEALSRPQPTWENGVESFLNDI